MSRANAVKESSEPTILASGIADPLEIAKLAVYLASYDFCVRRRRDFLIDGGVTAFRPWAA